MFAYFRVHELLRRRAPEGNWRLRAGLACLFRGLLLPLICIRFPDDLHTVDDDQGAGFRLYS